MSDQPQDFLDHDPADQDWNNASGDLKSLIDQVQKEITGWMPKAGDTVFGTVIDLSTATSEFGDYPLVTVETPGGRVVGVHCFHTVLRREIDRRIASGRLNIGDEIAIKYQGQGEAKGSQSAPEMYRVAVKPAGA